MNRLWINISNIIKNLQNSRKSDQHRKNIFISDIKNDATEYSLTKTRLELRSMLNTVAY